MSLPVRQPALSQTLARRISRAGRRFVAMSFTTIVIQACGGDSTQPLPTPPAPVPVESVTLNQAEATLIPQLTVQLSATPKDAGGNTLSGRTVSWQSSAAASASVSNDGMVTGLAVGTATITATSEGKTASASITVAEGAMIGAAGGVVFAAGGSARLTIPAGALTATLPISVTPLSSPPAPDGVVAGAAYELGPQGTTFAKPVTLEFKYAKGLVADSIDALRAVHRYTNGKWVVLPQSRYGSDSNGVVIAETNSFSTYAVRNASRPVDIKVSPAPLRLNPGQSATFSGIVMDQYGDPMSLPITWIDLGVSLTASISSAGLATGYRPGGPRAIQAQASKTFPRCFSDEERNCNSAGPQVLTGIGNGEVFVELIPVKTISITPPASTLLSGQTATLVPVLKDSAGITLSLDFRTIAWATSNASVASVSTSGVVTAVNPGGPVTITATSEGIAGTATVTVTGSSSAVASVVVGPGGQRVEVGTTTSLEARPLDAAKARIVGKTAVWNSVTPSVATVSATGVITAVAPGRSFIVATVDGVGGGEYVNVIAPLPLVAGSPSVGGKHTCLLRTDGSAWCWGQGLNGELGNGTTTATQASPVQVSGSHTFTALASGGPHTCALDATGKTWCWGDFELGLTGPSPVRSNIPVQAAIGMTFSSIYVGPFVACGLETTGAAWCWGHGFLGNGSSQISYTNPVPVAGSHRFTSMALGGISCGLTTTGEAWCWGSVGPGESLGDGTLLTSSVPVAVAGGHRFTALSAGPCGLKSNGEVWCWGASSDGTSVARTSPVKLATALAFTALSNGCALAADQTAWCWGLRGLTGDGFLNGPLYYPTPVQVFGGRRFTEISVGGGHTCARAVDGTWCWGFQDHGQLGFGDPVFITNQPPTKVAFP